MSDLDVAASNAADEQNDIVETGGTGTVETPEPLPIAKTNTEALDRAFEQVAQEPEVRAVQNRKPDGKFAKGKTEVKQEEPAQAAEAAAPQFDVNELANFGLTKEALAAAAKSDPAFLADAKRRFTELTQGIEKHKSTAESWSKVQRYDEMARQSGKSLDIVLDEYVNMENLLRERPMEGFAMLAQRLGINPADAGQALVQMAQGQQYQAPQPQQRYLTLEEARALARQESEALYSERTALEQIEKFKADHPRFEELQEDIAGMLAHPRIKALPASEKLKAAYDAAERLNPAAIAPATPAAPQTPAAATTTPAVQPAQPDPKTKAKANLSITGSPEGGSNPATRKIPGSTGDALDAAFARVGL